MVRLPWRRRLPADRRPALDRDERVVAWAAAGDDGVVVVTNLGVWLPARQRRLGWHEIHKVAWSGRQLSITAAQQVADEGAYQVMADLPPVGYTLLDPDRVPDQVRVRVNRSVAYTSHHPLPGGGVRVVGRRVSGTNGLRWTVRYDPGTDPAAPGVAATTLELVNAGRTTMAPAVE